MQTKFDRPSLIEVLVRQQAVTDSAAHEVLKRRGDKPGDIGPLLVSAGLITEEQLAQATAEQYGLPYDSLSNVEVDPKFYQTIPVKLMQRYPFIPIAEQDGVLTIAVADPANLLALDELELLLNRSLRLVVSPRPAIQAALGRGEGASHALRELEAEYRSVLV